MTRINQIELIAAICEELGRQGVGSLPPRKINAVIASANAIIAAYESPDRPSRPGMGLDEWLRSDDTGMSSRFMAWVLCGGPLAEGARPHDLDDFGRCSRFLDAVPSARLNLPKMRGAGKAWARLVNRWYPIEHAINAGDMSLAKTIFEEAIRGEE
jgi:hypothetical protein